MSAPLGLIIYAAVKPIFKIYFIIAVGFFLAKKNILSVTTSRDISDIIVTAIMPCLIFNNVVSNLVSSDIKFIGVIFFEGTLLFSVGALLGLCTHYICKSPKAWYGGLISVGIFPNISDLPIAYIQTLGNSKALFSTAEADKGVAYVCIFLASQVFYQFSLGLYKLVRYDFRDQLNNTGLDVENRVQSLDIPLEDTVSISPTQTSPIKSTAVLAQNQMLDKEPAPYSTTDASANQDIDVPSISIETEDLGSISSNDYDAKLLSESTKKQTTQSKQHDDFLQQKDSESKISKLPLMASQNSGYSINSEQHVRHRRIQSIGGDPLDLHQTRTADTRSMKTQDIGDVINEYSEFQRLKSHDARRVSSIASDCAVEFLEGDLESQPESLFGKVKHHVFVTLKNFIAPNSLSLIVALAIAMAPPLRSLFVKGSVHIPNAPDKQPPLSFIMDIASYIGAASVPLGLLILGATIARLRVNSMPPGFWKTALMITACRLIILPIFGVGLTTGLFKAGWFNDDRLIRFVSVIEFGLPNATALVYFTAFYTDPNSPDHLQMDCLAVCLIAQYAILFITLPFLVTFSLKVSMGY